MLITKYHTNIRNWLIYVPINAFLSNSKQWLLVMFTYRNFLCIFNSRDWYEIIWLPEILHFKNQPCNRFYPKKNQLECIGKAVMMLYLG